GKATFIAVTRQSQEREGVMSFAEFEINARLKSMSDARSRDCFVKKSNGRTAVDHLRLATSIERRGPQVGAIRFRQRESGVGVDGRERDDLRAVIDVVVLVSAEDEDSVFDDGRAEAGRRIVVLKRNAEAARRIGVTPVRIGVEAFVAERVKRLAVNLIGAAAQPNVNAPTGRPAIFGRELIGDDLTFFDGMDRKVAPLSRATVVVVVQAFDGDVIGEGRAAGERKNSGLLRG